MQSHTPVRILAPKKLAGRSGHVVATDETTEPATVTVKLADSDELVTVAADQLEQLA